MPEPKTMLDVTIEANNMVSMAAARELYEEKIEELVGGDKYVMVKVTIIQILNKLPHNRPYVSPEDMEKHHLQIFDMALEEFDKTKKMGGEEHSERYRKMLIDEIEETYGQYKVNSSRSYIDVERMI